MGPGNESLGTTLQDQEQAPKGHRGDVVRKDNDPHGSQRGLTSNFYFILYTFRVHISHQRICDFLGRNKKTQGVLLFLKIPT